MSIFDTDNVITEEYLHSRGFKRYVGVTSILSYSNRFFKLIYREKTESRWYRYFVANLVYYLEPPDDSDGTPQYTFCMSYRDSTDESLDVWKSKEFSSIRDKIDFELCINEFNKILDSVGHKIKKK